MGTRLNAGVVYQDVNDAQIPLNALHQAAHLLLVRDVGQVAPGVDPLGAVVVQSLIQVGLAAAVEGNPGPGCGQGLGNGKADAVCAARHKGHPALQGKERLIHGRAPHFCSRWMAKPPISCLR